MCGIAGIYVYHSQSVTVSAENLMTIREKMESRGPDGSGLWINNDKTIGLAHRRLSIIDLSERAAQPLSLEDGSLRIVFNGEIYNYLELRKKLEEKGHVFRTQSDTEVLLHLYQDRGQDMVHALRGMYAFAIWDEKNQGLFLARDPFGIKPLYYADNGEVITFASQVKALQQADGVDLTCNSAGEVGFFLLGYVPEPFTIFNGIKALPAGHVLWAQKNKNPRISEFANLKQWVLEAEESYTPLSHQDKLSCLYDSLTDSMQLHLIADVPVGIFLSAGLDSTSMLAYAREVSNEYFHTVTLGFDEYVGTECDEVPLALFAANHFGVKASTYRIERSDFEEHIEKIIDAMDQPSIDGVNTYFVSWAAAQSKLKVAISGLGGDELFGGYPSFKQIPRFNRYMHCIPGILPIMKGASYLTRPMIKRMTSPKYTSLFEYGSSIASLYFLRRALFMPWELSDMLPENIVKEGLENLDIIRRLEQTIDGVQNNHMKISLLEMTWYMRNQLLRDTDWASMAHSLEVRVPLVDIVLFRQILSLLLADGSVTKMDMVKALRHGEMPRRICCRKKTGFATPVREWLIKIVPEKTAERRARSWAKMVFERLEQ